MTGGYVTFKSDFDVNANSIQKQINKQKRLELKAKLKQETIIEEENR